MAQCNPSLRLLALVNCRYIGIVGVILKLQYWSMCIDRPASASCIVWGPAIEAQVLIAHILGASTKCTNLLRFPTLQTTHTRPDRITKTSHAHRPNTRWRAIGHSPVQSHVSKFFESLAFPTNTATTAMFKYMIYASSLESILRHLRELLTGDAVATMVHSATSSWRLHLRLVAAVYWASTRTEVGDYVHEHTTGKLPVWLPEKQVTDDKLLEAFFGLF